MLQPEHYKEGIRMNETKDMIVVKLIRWLTVFLVWFWNFGYYDVDASYGDGYAIKIKGWKRFIVRQRG
jgi:hypothetical protein